MASNELLQAIAVTAELTRTQLSQAAARVLADDLSRYPESQVMAALTRCRRELKSSLTIADVISRIDDGRPGVEESWARLSHAIGDEGATVVLTDEERTAFFVADAIPGDKVAARMAFKEAYAKAVLDARNEGRPVRWGHIMGHDTRRREVALLDAARLGRLPRDHVQELLPHLEVPSAEIMALIGPFAPRGAPKKLEI